VIVPAHAPLAARNDRTTMAYLLVGGRAISTGPRQPKAAVAADTAQALCAAQQRCHGCQRGLGSRRRAAGRGKPHLVRRHRRRRYCRAPGCIRLAQRARPHAGSAGHVFSADLRILQYSTTILRPGRRPADCAA
jgi:hypothetical protein